MFIADCHCDTLSELYKQNKLSRYLSSRFRSASEHCDERNGFLYSVKIVEQILF